MQVDLDMHKYKVHHNCKIDTARFEEGKRQSDRSALQVGQPLSRGLNAIRGHLAPPEISRTEIDMKIRPQMVGSPELKQLFSALAKGRR
jgi:hypothetical protein